MAGTVKEEAARLRKNMDKVYEAGQQAEYDRFWDNYQQNGKRNNYSYGFYMWPAELFDPKYDINLERGAYYTFQSPYITEITKNLTAKGCNMYGTFNSSQVLHTISKLIVSETTTYTNTFGNATALENITFDGVIGSTISFANSSKLTAASVQSIIDHLKDLTGATAQKVSFYSDIIDSLTDTQVSVILAKNWTI